MTVQECYAAMNGDYKEAMGRLMKEERIVKYLTKFLAATDYQQLEDTYAAKDWEGVFRTSHTLKGVALNLSISKLGASASAVCDAVRPGVAPSVDMEPLMDEMRADYNNTIAQIRTLLG